MGRAPCCDKANVKRGPWSPEEDKQLREFIEKHGTGGNWISLPQKAGLRRCGKSCRLRWLNYLRPNIKLGDFNEDEDRIICSLVAAIGSRWSIIAAHLPRRTDNDIKNYWNTKLKKKLLLGLQTQHKMLQQPHPQPQPPLLLPSTYSSGSAPTAAADLEGIPIPPCFATLNHQNGGDVIFGGAQYGDMEMEKVPLGGKGEASWGPYSTGAKASVCAPSTRAWSLYHC